jgi:hypothetical protein
MLYKFKSRLTGDLIMLEPNARRLLAIIGKKHQSDGVDKGILLAEHMPAAIAALEAAIAQEESERRAAVADAQECHEAVPGFEAISLRQRTLPFMEMMRRCAQAGNEIVWGV